MTTVEPFAKYFFTDRGGMPDLANALMIPREKSWGVVKSFATVS